MEMIRQDPLPSDDSQTTRGRERRKVRGERHEEIHVPPLANLIGAVCIFGWGDGIQEGEKQGTTGRRAVVVGFVRQSSLLKGLGFRSLLDSHSCGSLSCCRKSSSLKTHILGKYRRQPLLSKNMASIWSKLQSPICPGVTLMSQTPCMPPTSSWKHD